jgi:hypothetical protein
MRGEDPREELHLELTVSRLHLPTVAPSQITDAIRKLSLRIAFYVFTDHG